MACSNFQITGGAIFVKGKMCIKQFNFKLWQYERLASSFSTNTFKSFLPKAIQFWLNFSLVYISASKFFISTAYCILIHFSDNSTHISAFSAMHWNFSPQHLHCIYSRKYNFLVTITYYFQSCSTLIWVYNYLQQVYFSKNVLGVTKRRPWMRYDTSGT